MVKRACLVLCSFALGGCGIQSDLTEARSDLDGLSDHVGNLAEQVGEDADRETSVEEELAELRRQLGLTQELVGDGTDIEGNILQYLDDLDTRVREQDAEIAALRNAHDERLSQVEANKADKVALDTLVAQVGKHEAELRDLAGANLLSRMDTVEGDAKSNADAISAARSDLTSLREDHDDLSAALTAFQSDVGGMFEFWGPDFGGKAGGSEIFDGSVLRSPTFAKAKLLKSCDFSYIEATISGTNRGDYGVEFYSGTTASGFPIATTLFEYQSCGGCTPPGYTVQRVWVDTSSSVDLLMAPIPRSISHVAKVQHIGCINLP